MVSFAEEISALLPEDLPNRANCITLCARHLEEIVAINAVMNLTRIVSPRDAAIKHVLDSLLPWRHFSAVKHVADAGTGPGFPGLPLAIALPETRFTLLESTQKKARFVAETAQKLHLLNVFVEPVRAEDWLRDHQPDLITGRAVAPLKKALPLFSASVRRGARALLYKGPDAEQEMAEAAGDAARRGVRFQLADRYTLPDGMGERTLVEILASRECATL